MRLNSICSVDIFSILFYSLLNTQVWFVELWVCLIVCIGHTLTTIEINVGGASKNVNCIISTQFQFFGSDNVVEQQFVTLIVLSSASFTSMMLLSDPIFRNDWN